MSICFLSNIYCCYLPSYCSYGLQPLDNSIFNATKAFYRKSLADLASLTDSRPVDKLNFIKCYAKARELGITKKNILAGWRVTGNWPISRSKALRHPEIQLDKEEVVVAPTPYLGPDNTPKCSRHIRDLGKGKTPTTRRQYTVIARGFEAQEIVIASHASRITSLEEEVDRLKRGKKRRAIPNPNRRFMQLAEILAKGEAIPKATGSKKKPLVVESESEEEEGVSEAETASEIEVRAKSDSPLRTTRSGRIVKKPRHK
jgi:hypothetical protein